MVAQKSSSRRRDKMVLHRSWHRSPRPGHSSTTFGYLISAVRVLCASLSSTPLT